MNLLDIYNMLQTNQITEDEACTALNLKSRQWRMRQAKWGHRLPLMLSVLDKIKADQIKRDEAAAALGVTVRDINKLCVSWGAVRPIKPYLIERTTSKVKWEIRKKFAIDYIAGGSTLEDAADSAAVTERQMRRWVSELLKKHFEMPWKDLATLSDTKRRRLANEIEAAENLDLATQNVINSISRGAHTLEDEAIKRVVSRKKRATDVRRTTSA